MEKLNIRVATEGLLRRKVKYVLLFVFAAWLAPSFLLAQSTALLTGTVVDATGAVVPQASVACRNTQTALTYNAVTNAEGLFRFPSLPIGGYELVVTHAGFQKLTRSGLQLLTGQSVDLHLQLTVGGTVQSVEVTASAPVVQSTSSEVQTTITSRAMRELPLNGRNALQLVTLTAGTQTTGTGTEGNQEENDGVTSNGLRSVDNNYVMDGVSYKNAEFGNVPNLPNPDALQEFTMKSSNFSAAYSGPGATMLLSTRSGTNQFHGEVFEFLRNDALDSRNFFATTTTPFKRNQFGATFGGPVQKDKTFIFGSYQGTRKVGAASPSLVTVPTLAQRGGDFSSTGRTIINPATGKQFSGNMIPSTSFDAVGLKLLPLIPLPTPGLAPNRAQLTPALPATDDQMDVRVDRVFGVNDHFTARYYLDEFDYVRPTSPFTGINAKNFFLDQNLLITDTHTFSPNLLFVGSFGYTRTARTQIPKEPITLQSAGAKIPEAIAGAAPEMRVNIKNYVNLFSGGGLLGYPGVWEYRGQFTWTRGKHLLQFGMEVERDRMFSADKSFASGQFTFNGSRTGPAGCKNCGDSFADFLLGLPNNFFQSARTPQDFRQTNWAPWIEDDWKVLPRLTLNLGLRWEPWLPAYDLLGPAAGFEAGAQSTVAPLAPPGLLFTGDPGIRDSIWPADWNNFAPRVGFAWDVQGNGKTVVRGAFGIFYNTIPLNMIRTSNSGSAFRSQSVTMDVPPPASIDDPYAGFPGGDPFPFTPPPTSALKTYKFLLPVNTSLLDPHAKTGYTEEWNFTAERQILRDLGVSVSYVGNHQLKVMATRQINPIFPSTKVRVYPNYSPLALATPWEFANYNALQVSVTKRMTHGVNLIGNYVYSRCMDNESGETIGADAGGGSAFNNKFDINNGYGPCNWDLTHSADVSLVYDLPRVRAFHGPADKFLNGWETTSIITAQTGGPFTVSAGQDNSGSGSPNSDTADQINANIARPAGVTQLQEYFNTAAFVANPKGTFGNVGRNSLRGPGAWNVDFGLLKSTSITERLRAEFRFEAFNFFNHANFGNPNSTVNNTSNFGKIQGTKGNGLNDVGNLGNPRVLQFALKLVF
ncbi:MAG TPA: TonB-dependent receptor [Terriglobia bacterium]|nr:TonB-dependent receptor [Terriglobia bacterium]